MRSRTRVPDGCARAVVYRVLPSFTEFFFVSRVSWSRLDSITSERHFSFLLQIGFYLVLPSFTEFHRVLPSFTGFYLVLLGCTGFYLVLLGFT